MHPQPAAPDLPFPAFTGRFAMIAASLIALIARAFLRDPRFAPLILPLCARISRTARRLASLMAILAAGHLPPPRQGGKSGKTRVRSPIPTTRAWLVKTLRHEAGAYASQLAHLLAEPGMRELIDATPAVQRLLRPICWMLGLDTPPIGVARQDTPPIGVARQATGARLRAPKALVPLPLPGPTPPLCPRLLLRWPWVPHPHAKPA